MDLVWTGASFCSCVPDVNGGGKPDPREGPLAVFGLLREPVAEVRWLLLEGWQGHSLMQRPFGHRACVELETWPGPEKEPDPLQAACAG